MRTSNQIKIAIITLVVGVIIYSALGLATVIGGATIYERIPEDNFTISPSLNSVLIIKNNAPFSFPFVNPLFLGGVRVINSTGNITCEIEGYNCGDKIIDVGRISAGESKEIDFSITPDGNNFTISLNAYINIFLSFPIKSKVIGCKNVGVVYQQLYRCEEIKATK